MSGFASRPAGRFGGRWPGWAGVPRWPRPPSLSRPSPGPHWLVPPATAGFLAVVPATGGDWHPWWSLVVLAVSFVAARLPDSGLPLGLLGLLGAIWISAVHDHTTAWTLLAAGLLTVAHVACTVAGHGPPGVRLEPVLLRIWALRGVWMFAAAVPVWVLVRVLAAAGRLPVRAGDWVAGAAIVAVIAGTLVLFDRLGAGRRVE